MSTTYLTAAVAKGAAVLDVDKPGWFNEIELFRLDMTSDYRCILGQLYGTFEDGCRHFGWNMADSQAHGFDVAGYHLNGGDDLHPIWVECIRQRRLAVINS